MKKEIFKKIKLLLLLTITSIGYSSYAQGTDVIIWMDNSGSISASEWADMTTSTNNIIDQVLGCNSNNRVAVVHYGAQTTSPSSAAIYIESDFTNNATTAKSFVRRTPVVGDNDFASESLSLIGNALDNVTNANILSTQKTLNKISTNKLLIFHFTDAWRDQVAGGSTLVATGANPFINYNQFKTSRNAKFVSVYAVNTAADPTVLATAQATVAAIASVGGSYNGAVEANAGDPEGSGTKPRMAVMSTTFLLSATDLQTVSTNICNAFSCPVGTAVPVFKP